MTAVLPNFARGGQAAKDRAREEAEARKSKSAFNTWSYLSLKDGESVVIRFLAPESEWLEVKQHSFVPTKAAPADKPADKKWPANLGGVCRYSRGFEALYTDCFICDTLRKENGDRYFAATRLWASAVVRVEGPDGEKVDDTIEIDEYEEGKATGKTKTLPNIVVLNFGLKNFFDQFLGYAEVYKGNKFLSRDYRIKRSGSGTDTVYNATPFDPFPFDSVEFPEFDLGSIVAEQASDAHYERFFDTRTTVTWRKDGKPVESSKTESVSADSTPASDREAEVAEADANLDDLRAKLMSRVNNK